MENAEQAQIHTDKSKNRIGFTRFYRSRLILSGYLRKIIITNKVNFCKCAEFNADKNDGTAFIFVDNFYFEVTEHLN